MTRNSNNRRRGVVGIIFYFSLGCLKFFLPRPCLPTPFIYPSVATFLMIDVVSPIILSFSTVRYLFLLGRS
jgi:hypothetical protein